MKCAVASIAGLVEIGAAGVEIADRQRLAAGVEPEPVDQPLPIRHLLRQVRHIDAAEPQRPDLDRDKPVRFRQAIGEGRPLDEGPARGDEHAVAPRRRHRTRSMTIAERGQDLAQPLAGSAAAAFRNHQHIGIVPRQRRGDRRQPGPAAVADVPGEDAHPIRLASGWNPPL